MFSKKMFLKLVSVVLLFLFTFSLSADVFATSKKSVAVLLVNQETDWIAGAQRGTGALLISPTGDYIMPYFSNFAAKALAEAGGYNNVVKKYLEWYIDHINREPDNLGIVGTMYDYDIVNGREVSKDDYDSSDSYAATFLSAVYSYYKSSRDIAFVEDHLEDLKLIASAIDATMQSYNLTYAKADYHVAYLMDNVEVWRGYLDFGLLLKAVDDNDANLYLRKAKKVAAAIESKLWNKNKKEYRYALGEENDWSVFYPDASANLWPLIFGMPEGYLRRNLLWDKFITNQPGWVENETDDFPWMVLGVAAVKAGDISTFNRFVENTKAKFYPKKEWPWYIGESAWYVQALKFLE